MKRRKWRWRLVRIKVRARTSWAVKPASVEAHGRRGLGRTLWRGTALWVIVVSGARPWWRRRRPLSRLQGRGSDNLRRSWRRRQRRSWALCEGVGAGTLLRRGWLRSLLRRGSGSIHRRWLRLRIHGRLAAKHVLAVVNQVEQIACLGLASPPRDVVASDLAAGIHVGSFADGHVWRGRHKCHRWLSWIVSGNPVSDGDVVGGVAELHRNRALEREQQLRATIVESEDLSLGRER